jgi:hypothetical protein
LNVVETAQILDRVRELDPGVDRVTVYAESETQRDLLHIEGGQGYDERGAR